MTGNLVAIENQFSDSRLGALVVPEAHFLGPHVIEDNASGGSLDRATIGNAMRTSRCAEIGIAITDARMVGNVTIGDGELDLGNVVEERQMLFAAIHLAGDLAFEFILLGRNRQEVQSQAHILGRRHNRLAGGGRED